MILTESIVKVPCNKYTLRVKCTATRRLTTIEWLLLTCIHKFNHDVEMKSKQIKYAFEDVLHMTSSEFLIKPCVKNLERIGVITTGEVGEFEYAKLKFEQLTITDRGISMLKEGLLPGESREQSATVYYNPLTGKMNTFEPRFDAKKEAVTIGERDDFDQTFPEKEIIECLQKGNVMGQRFTASKSRIDEVDLIDEGEWDNVFELSIGVNEESKQIYLEPEFINQGFYTSIKSLLNVKGLSDKTLQNYSDASECDIRNVIGAGNRVKNAILDVCRNGNTILIDTDVYKIVKANKTAFNGKTVIFTNAEKFGVVSGDFLQIDVPASYLSMNCAILNEKREHVFLASGSYKYGEINTKVPIAFENIKLVSGEFALDKWIEKVVKDNMDSNIGYLALFALQVTKKHSNSTIKMLKLRWKDLQFDELVKELICISSYISTIGEAAFNICDISDTIIEKINFSDNNIALTQIKNLMELSIVNKNVDNKAFYTKEILKKAKKPESYIDMLQLYQAVGINSHEFALRFDDEITSIYNKKIVSELIVAIMERKYQKIPEFFEYDVFFNDFSQCIDAIGNLLSGVNLYQRIERDKLEENIGKCVDSAALKSYIEQMESKRIFLANQHLDLNNIMSEYNQSMTENFAENINIIKQNIDDQAAFLTLSSEEKKLRTVFVLDTCAIIHHPDLLNYFSMDEYIRIPTKVIDELGKIKDGRSNKYDYETSNIARNVSKDIENALITMNKQTAYRFVIENANTDLLPLDLDPMVPDNQILSVAMKYLEEKPIIISDDGVFRLTSTSQNIETISGADFIQSRKNGTRSMPRVEVTEQKKDNVDVSIDTPPDVTETTWKKLPLSSLRKIAPVMDNNVITYLSQNKIRTIGDFFELTLEAVDRLPGRAKQAIYKNAINSVINKKDEIMTLIQSGALN